jgi:hypothetical protein
MWARSSLSIRDWAGFAATHMLFLHSCGMGGLDYADRGSGKAITFVAVRIPVAWPLNGK